MACYCMICVITTVILDNSTQIILPSDRIDRCCNRSMKSKNSFQLIFIIDQTEEEWKQINLEWHSKTMIIKLLLETAEIFQLDFRW